MTTLDFSSGDRHYPTFPTSADFGTPHRNHRQGRAMNDSDAFLRAICKDDPAAVSFCQMIVEAAHFLDDVADGDHDLPRRTVEAAAQMILVDLPGNAFFAAHRASLAAVMTVAVTNWSVANEFEEDGDPHLLGIARILRSSFVDVLVLVAALVGGAEHGRWAAEAVRRATHHETQVDYEVALAREKAARGVEG